MVWQLTMKSEGKYRPDYDFADGDYMQVRVAELDPDWPEALQMRTAAFGFGTALSPEHVPTRIEWKSTQPLYDFLTPHGATCISNGFRHIIEQLEPGVHQFLSLEMVDAKGNHLADHWIWVPLNRLDSVDREHTTMILPNRTWLNPSDLEQHTSLAKQVISQPTRLVFNEQQVNDRHFWRDIHIATKPLLCSEKAAEIIGSANLRGVKLIKKESV